MTISSDTKVGRVAVEQPPATRVFSRHGIDYCCRGGISLGEACARQGSTSRR